MQAKPPLGFPPPPKIPLPHGRQHQSARIPKRSEKKAGILATVTGLLTGKFAEMWILAGTLGVSGRIWIGEEVCEPIYRDLGTIEVEDGLSIPISGPIGEQCTYVGGDPELGIVVFLVGVLAALFVPKLIEKLFGIK